MLNINTETQMQGTIATALLFHIWYGLYTCKMVILC